MGFDIQDYPHPLLASLLCFPQSIGLFQSALTVAIDNNCDVFITPIFPDVYLQNTQQQLCLDHCFILSDQHLKKFQLNMITPLVNQCVWKLPLARRRKIMQLLFGYSSYLNLKYIAIKLDQQDYVSIMETLIDQQMLKELRKSVPNIMFIIETSGDNDEQSKADDKIWLDYIELRRALNKVTFPLFVDIGIQIKANAPANRIINRWKSQKICLIIISEECFTENSKGFAVLPAKHQRIVNELVVLKSCVCLKMNQLESTENDGRKRVQEYLKYVVYTFRKMAQNKLRSEKEAINLQDFLQSPLQPYADNLESCTYQVFEHDEHKYDQYQGAIQSALQTYPKNKKIIIYYIGTGRGGLLFNVFAAARKTQRKVFVYAIEKNLYPIQTIKKRVKQNQWQHMVKIVYTDIRDYQMPEKPDIFLSQLLGGFGDNQLSPQCLYWAEKNIAPDTICIPTDYVSYIKPVSYQYIHRKIQLQSRQIYYTVNYGSYYTNFPSQQVWRFTHPIRKPTQPQPQTKQPIQQPPKPQISSHPQNQGKTQTQKDTSADQHLFDRYSKNKFTTKQDIVINGFAGYFTSHLYDYSELSILPQKPTFGMYSWYPIFFCFQEEVFVAKGADIEIQIWRKGNPKKVWYQWRYKVGDKQSIVHNKQGVSVAIQL